MTTGVRIDLHVHSRYSPDGAASLSRLAEATAVAGLQGFAITDHNTIEGHQEIPRLRASYPRLLIIPGAEISTQEGHVLALGIRQLPAVGGPLALAVESIRSQGGVAILAHPYRWTHGVGDVVARTAKIDAIETLNGHNGRVANARADLVAASRGVPSVGGSDAHRPIEVGRTHTEFVQDVNSPDEALEELRLGHVHAGGHSLSTGERVWLAVRSGFLRAGRGFRPI